MGSIKSCEKFNVLVTSHVFLYKLEEMAAGKNKPQDLEGAGIVKGLTLNKDHKTDIVELLLLLLQKFCLVKLRTRDCAVVLNSNSSDHTSREM